MATALLKHPHPSVLPLRTLFFLAALTLALLLSATVNAEIYKYRDDDGRLIFVDDKDKIPSRYQEQKQPDTYILHFQVR